MSLVWAIPFMMALIGGAAVVALVRATADSARELGQEIARFGELHVAVAEVRTELQQAGGRIHEIKAHAARQ